MLMGMRAALVLFALAGTAGASPAWIGQVQSTEPVAPCADCPLSPVLHAATLVVLPPKDAAPPQGDVVIIQPLVGIAVPVRVDQGTAALPWYLLDRRDGDNGVLVLPAGSKPPRIVPAQPADVAQIKQALLRNEVLSHIGKAVAKLEVGAVDVDGDGKADFAVTYGCAAWGDGSCQLKGQFPARAPRGQVGRAGVS